MRVEELDLKELLEVAPSGGLIHFAGQRAVIIDAVAQGLLRKELVDSFGDRVARGILSRFGYIHGRRMAEAMRSQFKWDTGEDWQNAGPKIYSLQGLFQMDPADPRPFGSEGGTWRTSYEAEQHLIHLGKADHPVCWTLCGLVSGYLSFTRDEEIYALEDKCIGMGHAACHVTLIRADQSTESTRDHIAYFKREGIDSALVEVTGALKRAERKLKDRNRKIARISSFTEDPSGLVARSPGMRRLLDFAQSIAKVDSTIFITGESGTGKERLARFVHEHSASASGPFVAVNCGAITETLLESELFGHARGSFSGATSDRPGLFEAANGGTLFLDEVGEIPPAMQVKLLRALQEREIRRVGENKSRPIHVRIITATNKNLKDEVAAKRFREDLYYRLKVIELAIPPLRERKEDILPLARILLADAALHIKRNITGITAQAADRLLAYSWPGNVRELENVMERAVAVATGERVTPGDLSPEVRATVPMPGGAAHSLDEMEKNHILAVLENNHGNRSVTAKILGIGTATLQRKLTRYKRTPSR